jgi:NCS1 family nucleobase:cation symporter-1
LRIPAYAGALIQVPFSATAMFIAYGRSDERWIAWIVGLVVVAPLYYFAARVFRKKAEAAPFQSPAFAADLIEAPRA